MKKNFIKINWIMLIVFTGIICFFSTGCKKENTNAALTVPIHVGQSYQGGVVAYILQIGDPSYVAGETHGIIVAPSDQSIGIKWYNGSNLVTGANGTELGTGNTNTVAIIAAQGNGNYAAKLCYDLVLNGYTDWYLPSIDELSKIYLNKVAIGGFSNVEYWSSSEYTINNVWYFNFPTGHAYPGLNNKNFTYRVRAVRAF